jgi:RHS repeat-associated protein
MAVVGPKQFNFVRVWKSLRIAVSGGQHRNYSGSFPDAFSAKLHICRCDTSCMLNRRFETEQLLNCRRNYLGTFAQFFERFRISKKGKKSARNEICGRLMAANHGNDRAGDYLVIRQPRTVNFGGHQGVNESAVWTGAQFLHLPDHISLQVLKASHDRRNPAGMVLKIAKDFSDVDHPRADGLRLAKASLAPPNGTAFNTALCSPLINGYTLYEYYTISQSGQQMQRFNNSGWENDNIYAGGKLLVSLAGDQQYFGDNQYYQLSDWLGTRHGQVTSDGNPAHLLEFFSLPFGETAAPVGSGIDISNLHFTGKQTDLESGNDDFRARSYDPLMGRFLSPDWSKSPEAVPYADLSNPQSLNLYAYVNNNPLSRTDKDGHFWEELKNWFGAAGCWCNAVQAATAIQNMRNDLQTWQAKFNGQAPDYQHISPGQVRSYHDQFTTAANAFSQQQQSQAGELSILRFLHGKELLEQNSNISSIRQMSTQQIIDSLKPGQSGSLKVKPDGTVMDGNTRLRVLEERGVDINNLPRDIHTSEPIAPWESPEGEGPIEPIP